MGKKLLCLIVSAVLTLALVSCGGDSVKMDNYSGAVVSNGGFSAQTDDYVYFINGIDSYSTTYKTGDVRRGALLRMKKTDLRSNSDTPIACDTIVSKLLVADDKDAGVYIFGDYVYYAVPSTENDKTGQVKSDKILFFKTKLDGSKTSSKLSPDDYDHSATYRFIASGEKVYLVVYATSLHVYDTDSRKEIYSSEKVDEIKSIDAVAFPEDNAGAEIFFTTKPVNEDLYDVTDADAKQSQYSVIHRLSLSSSKYEVSDEIVIDGIGLYEVRGEGAKEGTTLTGVTFDNLRYKGGILYFAYTMLDTTVGATVYNYINNSDLQKSNAGSVAYWEEKAVVMSYNNRLSASVFTATTYINNEKCLLYVDATYGLMKYDYSNTSSDVSDLGRSVVFSSEEMKGATLDYVQGDYLYYHNGNYYYRIDLTSALQGEEVSQFKMNRIEMNTTWYKPEVVHLGDVDYLLGVYNSSDYGNYVYYIDLAKVASDVDAYKADDKDYYTAELTDDDKAAVMKTRLGVLEEDEVESNNKITEVASDK